VIRRVAALETTVLLIGETGTGKTRLARLIHELSPHRHEPFLVLDCAALSADLVESELFGHVQGAFPGAERDRPGQLEAAGRGTLLLDEVNSLPWPVQAKLLRTLDEHTFRPAGSREALPLTARVIAASSVDLEREVAAGHFRSDLYYRLDVVEFRLPALRRRRGSIVPLALVFLAEQVAHSRPDLRRIRPEALQALRAYAWPGNVRELHDVIERSAAVACGPDIGLTDLPERVRVPGGAWFAVGAEGAGSV
jgi:transcriptional regulator with PAS, ATPase and Fis domain